jgi:hypothetical protein
VVLRSHTIALAKLDVYHNSLIRATIAWLSREVKSNCRSSEKGAGKTEQAIVYRSLPWFRRMFSQAGKPMASLSPLDLTMCQSNASLDRYCRSSQAVMTVTCHCRRLACRHECSHAAGRYGLLVSFERRYWIPAASGVECCLGQVPLRARPHLGLPYGIKEGDRPTR